MSLSINLSLALDNVVSARASRTSRRMLSALRREVKRTARRLRRKADRAAVRESL